MTFWEKLWVWYWSCSIIIVGYFAVMAGFTLPFIIALVIYFVLLAGQLIFIYHRHSKEDPE
jgi:hypothetical protein